jgi:protein-disulfide isomerase
VNTSKNANIIWILLVGIIIGFLLGQLWITVSSRFAPQTSLSDTQQTLTTTESQQSQQEWLIRQAENVNVTPKYFESVKNVSPDDDPFMGPKDAKLTIVEFTDYQCPFCKKYFEGPMQQIKKDYVDTGKVKYVLRDFPLAEHPQALLAAATANCAAKQNKFWEMHDLLFSNQNDWSYNNDAAKIFSAYAARLNLNATTFEKCVKNKDTITEIAKDGSDGELYGVSRTPTIFIGERKIIGAQDYNSTFKVVIEQELAAATKTNVSQGTAPAPTQQTTSSSQEQ